MTQNTEQEQARFLALVAIVHQMADTLHRLALYTQQLQERIAALEEEQV